MTSISGVKGNLAVIVGGGVAGLASAIALSSHFARVLVVERDRYPDHPATRPHVPQGSHVHVLLAKGLQILTRFVPEFPGWLDELGLHEGDLTRDVRIYRDGKWLPRLSSGIPFRPCTRPIVEHLLLRAARGRENIQIDDGTRVLGLIGGESIRGVEVRSGDGSAERISCDWVVDAGGRRSTILEFLDDLGIDVVEQEAVDAGVAYHSCVLLPPPEAEEDWILAGNVARFPDQPEMAVLMRIDGGRWLSALITHGREEPPAGHEQMLGRMARCLPDPLSRHVRAAEPQSEIVRYGKAINRRHRFARIEGWPERLVALGDSACMLNPRYGQGMTVAALGVQTLEQQLESHWLAKGSLAGLSRRFQRRLEQVLATPWRMATVEDQLWATKLKGEQTGLLDAVVVRATSRMLDTVFGDVDTYLSFMKVAHMLDTPRSLMTPMTVAKFLFPSLRAEGARGRS